MPYFTVSVRRTGAHRDIIVAEASVVWWGPDGRAESELARVTLEMAEPAPSREVLGRALHELAEAVTPPHRG